MTDLNGKVVLATGSSRGIGAEMAVASPDTREGRPPRPRYRSLGEGPSRHHQRRPRHVCHRRRTSRSSPTSRPFGRAGSRRNVWSTCWLPAPAAAAAARSIEDIGEESWRADLDANLTATFLTIKSFCPA
jgi:3-oxoacyl-[acyl-carrier protein] reductase